MTDYLRVQDGAAVEVWTAPEGLTPQDCFPEELATTFYPAGSAKLGWIWDGEAFSAPIFIAPAQPKAYDFLGFLNLFSLSEQSALVSSTDARVKLFCLMLASTNLADLKDSRVIEFAKLLEEINIIAQDRAAQVLAGQTPPSA